jgi:hypothetical protein
MRMVPVLKEERRYVTFWISIIGTERVCFYGYWQVMDSWKGIGVRDIITFYILTKATAAFL